MDRSHSDLASLLRKARLLVGRPENDFTYSHWNNVDEAVAELDAMIAVVEEGGLPPRDGFEILFAPTGSTQEVSLDSGWGGEFLVLAQQVDVAVERAYRGSVGSGSENG
jgi:hypothetical protein